MRRPRNPYARFHVYIRPSAQPLFAELQQVARARRQAGILPDSESGIMTEALREWLEKHGAETEEVA